VIIDVVTAGVTSQRLRCHGGLDRSRPFLPAVLIEVGRHLLDDRFGCSVLQPAEGGAVSLRPHIDRANT
jgi:hypothetical protein